MAISKSGNLIEAAQTITGSWVDVGATIETNKFSFFTSYIDLDINDSKDVQFRYRALFEEDGDEFIIPLRTRRKSSVTLRDYYFEVDNDVDQKFVLEEQIDDTVTLIKLQVRAETVGATAGQILSAKYIQGYRQ